MSAVEPPETSGGTCSSEQQCVAGLVKQPKVRLRRSEKVLVCLIQALVGKQVMLELRKDTTIQGVLDECDDSMNVVIRDATAEDLEGSKVAIPLVFVRGSNIRFVHIPKTVDVSQAVESRRMMLDTAAQAYLGSQGLPSKSLKAAPEAETSCQEQVVAPNSD